MLQRLELFVQFGRRAAIGGVPFLPQLLVASVLFLKFPSRGVLRDSQLFVFVNQLGMLSLRFGFAFFYAGNPLLNLFRLASQFVRTLSQFCLLLDNVATPDGQRIEARGRIVGSTRSLGEWSIQLSQFVRNLVQLQIESRC